MNYIDKINASTAETRAESHTKVILKSGGRHETILRDIAHNGAATRAKLAERTGFSESSLCGRLNELVKMGQLTVGPTEYNTKTERHVVTYHLTANVEHCPDPKMAKFDCLRASQCFEPCGKLGHDEKHAVVHQATLAFVQKLQKSTP